MSEISSTFQVPASEDFPLQESIDLKVRIANLESRLTSLLAEDSIPEEKIQEIINGLRESSETSALINKMKIKIEEDSKIIQNLKKRISEFESKEDELSRENAELSSRVAVLQSRNGSKSSDCVKAVQDLKLENSQLKQEIAILESTNAELSIENLSLKSKINDMTNVDSQANTEIERLKQANTELSNKNKVLQNEIQKINHESSLLNQKIANISQSHLTSEKCLQNTKQMMKSQSQCFHNACMICRERSDSLMASFSKFSKLVAKRTKAINKKSTTIKGKFNQYESKVLSTNNRKHVLFSKVDVLIQSIVGLDNGKLPHLEKAINCQSDLDSFIEEVESANAVKEAKHLSEIRNLQNELQKEKEKLKRNQISHDVANVVIKMQENLAQMTERIHTDHEILMERIDSNTF